MKKVLLILAVLLLLLVPPVWAPPTLDTDQYEDSFCASPRISDVFDEEETVYARATGLNTRKTYYFEYYDDASTLQCTSPGYTGVSATCDTSGCYLDPLYQEGTWTVRLLEGTKEKHTDTFTVNAFPEFPSALGFGAVFVFSGFIYILIRRRVVGDIGKD